MPVAVFGAKGGSGVSTVCAMFGAALAGASDPGALVVDLVGDQPALCGVDPGHERGATDWAAALPGSPADAIDRLGVDVVSGLRLLARGRLHPSPSAAASLVDALRDRDEAVLIDCGQVSTADSDVADDFREAVVRACDHRLLVTRACYLGLRAAADLRETVNPTAVVLVVEPGRALGRHDVEVAVGAPVLVEVATDSSIARLVDAGLLVNRLPRTLRRCLRAGWLDVAGGETLEQSRG